jgi:hypothetical protein
MNISTFKKMVEALGRFADMRAPDNDPRSKIGVQVSKSGALTLISGSSCCGLLYRIEESIQFGSPVIFAIEAKPLLQAAKVLKGKGSVSFEVGTDSLCINVENGGSVNMIVSCDIKDAGFPSKVSGHTCSMKIESNTWEQLYRIIPAVSTLSIEPPTISMVNGTGNIVCVAKGDRPMYARYSAQATGHDSSSTCVDISFWEALKALDADGVIYWGDAGVSATAGNIEVWSKSIKYDDKFEPWPILEQRGNESAFADIDRTSLIESLRGVTPGEDIDKYGRITFEIKDGFISLSSFGDEGGISIPCKSYGKTTRTLRSEYFIKMLRASVGKTVRVGVYQAPPISISSPEMSGWTILVAPVALG